MYCVPPRTTSAPKVPPQQVIVCAEVLVLKSLASPPEVPNTMAPDWACSFAGTTVTVAVPDAELLTCDTALTVTVVVTLPPLLSDFVGTPLGATYNPLAEMNPKAWLPPETPLTSQVTALLCEPFTDAVNCCVPKFATFAALGDTLTEVTDTVTGALLDALEQPRNRRAMQPRPPSNEARMQILTRGAASPFSKAGTGTSGQHRAFTHKIGLWS